MKQWFYVQQKVLIFIDYSILASIEEIKNATAHYYPTVYLTVSSKCVVYMHCITLITKDVFEHIRVSPDQSMCTDMQNKFNYYVFKSNVLLPQIAVFFFMSRRESDSLSSAFTFRMCVCACEERVACLCDSDVF